MKMDMLFLYSLNCEIKNKPMKNGLHYQIKL